MKTAEDVNAAAERLEIIRGAEVSAIVPSAISSVDEAERLVGLLESRMAYLSHRIEENRALMADGDYVDPMRHGGFAFSLSKTRAKLAQVVRRRDTLVAARRRKEREERAKRHQEQMEKLRTQKEQEKARRAAEVAEQHRQQREAKLARHREFERLFVNAASEMLDGLTFAAIHRRAKELQGTIIAQAKQEGGEG